MREHETYALLTLEEAKRVAQKDATTVSTCKEYASKNELGYYLATNTWLMSIRTYAPHVWARIKELILRKGLIYVINIMQEEAAHVVTTSGTTVEPYGPWAKLLLRDIRMTNPTTDDTLNDTMIGRDEIATLLFLLRFPKRFSPIDNDKVEKATIKEFLQCENRSKVFQRQESFAYTMIVPYVRQVIEEMYPWDFICSSIDELNEHDWILSSGSALDAKPTTGSKVKALCKDGNINYVLPIHGVYTLDRKAAHIEGTPTASIRTVPKSYKASRIIAMEKVARLAKGKAIEQIFRQLDSKSGLINVEHQDWNQQYAQLGSLEGLIATLDATHASDTITKSHFVDLFPKEYTRRVMPLLPKRFSIKTDNELQYRPMQMASTAGHTLTFRHEMIIYYAVAEAAVRFYEGITGRQVNVGVLPRCRAFGDDSEAPVECIDVILYFFKRLGFIINESKSFWKGNYRESCGKDYIDGVDVSSIYFPRFPIVGSIKGDKLSLSSKTYNDEYRGKLDNSLTMLISLQKKLFPHSYEASRFVASIVTWAYPKMTYSLPGEVCGDLWDYMDTGIVREPKTYQLERIDKTRILPRNSTNFRYKLTGKAVDTLSGGNREVFTMLYRLDAAHYVPIERRRAEKDCKFTDFDIAVYEYWKYQYFLQSGPQFEDPLLELLGISSRPASISEFYGKRTLDIVAK
jgi:hypothetical protein